MRRTPIHWQSDLKYHSNVRFCRKKSSNLIDTITSMFKLFKTTIREKNINVLWKYGTMQHTESNNGYIYIDYIYIDYYRIIFSSFATDSLINTKLIFFLTQQTQSNSNITVSCNFPSNDITVIHVCYITIMLLSGKITTISYVTVTYYYVLHNSYIVEWEITTNNYVTVTLCFAEKAMF